MRSRSSRRSLPILLLLMMMMVLIDLEAASILDFPRLSSQSGSIVGVAIVNPGSADAVVSLTAYGMGGEVLGEIQVVVPAGQRLGLLASNLFPNLEPGVVGWFQAVSDVSGLTGFFLFLNTDPSELDGADLPIRDRDIVFNKIQIQGELSTELNIANPGSAAVDLELTLIGAPDPVVRVLEIAAFGAARIDVATFFGVNEVADGAYVVVNSTSDIVGFEFIRRQGADLQGLNARSAEEFLNTLYFAQMAVLGPFEAELGLVNYSSKAVIAVVSAYKPDGSLFVEEAQQNPVTIALDPGGSVNRDLQSLFQFQGSSVLQGWLEVSASTEAINGQLTYRRVDSGAAAVAVVAQGSKASIFAHIATTFGFLTGVAALNPAAMPATVEIAVVNSEGVLLGGFTTVLNPGQRISELITDLVPEAADLAGGFIWVRSNVPLFLTALFGTVEGDVLANVPAQSVSSAFDPAKGTLELKIDPPLAVLSPTNAQGFDVAGGVGAVDWLVNDIVGGSSQFGTISNAGFYTAPAIIVPDLPITVSARSGNQSAAAGVGLISQQELVADLGIVQSVAYLGGLDRLFSAELVAVFGPAEGSVPSGFVESSVNDITPPDTRLEIAGLDDTITHMIAFLASNGQEYLLFCASESETVQRVDPVSGATVIVASDLNAPQSIAFDTFSDTLLVAELDKISTLPRSALERNLPQGLSDTESPTARVPASELIPNGGVGGIAVDRCTGNIYFSVPASGEILCFSRSNGAISTLASGFIEPRQLLPLYRDGFTCPGATHLFIVEPIQVSMIILSPRQLIRPWLVTGAPVALAYIPLESSLTGQGGLLIMDFDEETSTTDGDFVPLPGLYSPGVPVNPPVTQVTSEEDTSSPPGPDLVIAGATGQPGENVTVNVFFRPGPGGVSPAASGQIAAAVFAIDYDQTKLSFDPTDANGDGIPEAIIPSLPGAFEVIALFDPADAAAELKFIVVDIEGPTAMSEGNILSITFESLAETVGTTTVAFGGNPEVSIADTEGVAHVLDELVAGKVSFFPQAEQAGFDGKGR